MPYIDTLRRTQLDSECRPQTAGELNYAITRLVDRYLVQCGPLRYAHLNEVIGVLECAKLELYRRLAAPYEDGCLAKSGDVYTIQERSE